MITSDFIFSQNISDISLCDEIIKFHKNSPDQEPGRTGYGEIKPEWKDSVDLILPPQTNIANRYIEELNTIAKAYIEKFPWSNQYAPWSIIEGINVQYYKPGGGFHIWHTERSNAHYPRCYRHLVFMTYLNDVFDEGETEWFHQKIKIKPKKGLTIIWPTDWTYTHRGIPSPSEEKYIVTGWFSYLPEELKKEYKK
jgi:hypothetical protein